ncbi:MAG: glutamine--tRNA ligase/YqeY domain fusion protein [Acidobacteriota bacterium]
MPEPGTSGLDFIRAIVAEDLATGKHGGRVATRFPPEPNGYLHIGHAKSICLNFGVAEENGGTCNLRFDDTNPTTEETGYAESIMDNVRWLGFEWNGEPRHASDYFKQLYQYAVQLIEDGKAYVDSLSEAEIRQYRGTVSEPGQESPYRHRSAKENLDLFRRMRAGEFEDGAHVLRAKIDMASANMKMRDPLLYRIRHAHHYRTGDTWCIYPMYDFAHPLSDAIEGITHSLCTLEFENNREIYDWLIDNVRVDARPRQFEFARLNLDYTVMSKRKLLELVEEGHVNGWDDPRMPTLAGLRRRGVTPESIRAFCDLIGVARADSRVDMGKLEYCMREDLNQRAPRVMCVLRPLKVIITNYPQDQREELDAPFFPPDVGKEGSRKVPFSRTLYIERDDFREEPPEKFFRLAPGREVRLRYAYFIKCVDLIKDEQTGEITELHCTYDPDTRGGSAPDGRKVKGTLHWVSAEHSLPAEVRLYDRLFTTPNPDEGAEGQDFKSYLNPDSIVVLHDCRIEPSVAGAPAGSHFQFERQGYFFSDPMNSTAEELVFNRTVGLRDSWAKIAQAAEPAEAVAAISTAVERTATTTNRRGKRSKADARRQTRADNPELAARMSRYTEELGLPPDQADILSSDLALARFFEEALAAHDNPRAAANWLVHELLRELKERRIEELPFSGAELGTLVALIDEGTISGKIAKEVFKEMVARGGDPSDIVRDKGLAQLTDAGALEPIVDRLVAEHPDKVAQYRAGRAGLLGFFVGQAMKETRGTANPELVQDLFRRKLS